MHFTKQDAKYYAGLLIILIVAYLPLSTLHFAMKNDAFSDNFPDKYFISQCLHAGVFPLWNPYMNFGFPIYADPGFAFWNPFTWLFAALGYSAYTLTIEVLLYIYLAGICMFRLGRWLKFSLPVSFAIACMYMCCGFFTGSLQYINFITAAAFLPLLVQCFLQLLNKPCLKTSVWFALSFILVCAGGHPAIPIGSVYFLLILLICLISLQKHHQKNIRLIAFYLFISIIFFGLMALPALYSYASVWQFYGRDTPQQHFEITNIGFSISSLISFLFPFSTTAKTIVFNNDVAMRSAYISLPGFAGLLFAFSIKKSNVTAYIVTAFLMMVLSFGGSFKECVYQYLPLLKFVRTNGEYRVFFMLMLCITSGYGWQQFFLNEDKYQAKIKVISKYFLLLCIMVAVCIFIVCRQDAANNFKTLFQANLNLLGLKAFLNDLSFADGLLISVLLAIVITIPLIILKRISFKKLLLIMLADLVINCIIYLPVTGVGTTTVSTVQSYYDTYPTGIPVPYLIPVNKTDTLDAKTTGLVGSSSYYNKNIGTVKLTDYPSYFISTDSFFKSSVKNTVLKKPYIFLLSGSTNFKVVNFYPQNINIMVNAARKDTLVLLQNNYTFWKAYNNNKETPVSLAFLTFMSVPLHEGLNNINFKYKDDKLLWFFLISLIMLSISAIIIIKKDN